MYHGSATGLAATPSSTPDDADQATAYFGGWVTHAGDVNGECKIRKRHGINL